MVPCLRRASDCLIRGGRPQPDGAATDLGEERPAGVEPRPRTTVKHLFYDSDMTAESQLLQSSSASHRFSSAMLSSFRRYRTVLPILRELSKPARCRIARFWEAADCESPRNSKRPAGTPPWASAALIPNACSGSFSHVRNSIRPGCAKALSTSWMSSGRFI